MATSDTRLLNFAGLLTLDRRPEKRNPVGYIPAYVHESCRMPGDNGHT